LTSILDLGVIPQTPRHLAFNYQRANC
jgi:hypothetical protein